MSATPASLPANTASAHYDEKYFSYQNPIGEFGGWANLTKFQAYVKPDFRVVDFGCGGGYLLKNLDCREKVGIEVNPAARREAAAQGIATYASTEHLSDEWADLIISSNALEHTLHPLQEMQALLPKVKRGGSIVFVVPCESITYQYVPNDINHHLYSWSPMCLGNLFTEAGFVVEESKPYIHKWPRNYRKIAKYGGRRLFEICCRLYGRWETTWYQVRVVAHRPH